MPEYSYVAITKSGKKESAVIQAPNLAAAGHLLKDQGLLPTQIQERQKHTLMEALKGVSTISLAEKVAFVENLGVMLKAGIPVSRALQIQVKQTRNPRFNSILADIRTQVEGGRSLSESLGKYPGVFSNIFLSMIRVGEMSGNLEKSLEYLTVQLHREQDLKSKTRGAMVYPAVIVSALVVIGVLMAIFVLPKLTSIFKELGTELPLMTRIVISVADFMSGNAVVVILGMIGAVAAAVVALRNPAGKRAFDIALLHFIVINPLIKKINLARFARVLSSLLKSGVPIVQGLEVSGQSLGNIAYREVVSQAAVDVKLGKPLTESLNKNNTLFPVLVVQMIQVGEESGTVETILEQLAQHYEEEVDYTLRNMSSIIEPLLLLFIGGVVGILAVALIAPIYNIGQNM